MTRLGLVLVCLCLAAPAGAHKVNLFAYREGGRVQVEGYFVDGTPSRNARIEVYAPDGARVAEGATDDEGLFSFPAEDPSRALRIVMVASMGHRTEITLAGEDGEEVPPEAGQEILAGGAERGAAVVSGQEDLEAAVDRALAARLRPIQEALVGVRRALEAPRLSEVLGGLGYIVGLAGMYLWGRSRRG